MKKQNLIIYISTVIRIFLGCIMLYAASTKIIPKNGLTPLNQIMLSIRAYRILPAWSVKFAAIILPSAEILIGLFLLFGLFTRYSAILLALLMLIFSIGIISASIRGLQIDCGCFSPGGELKPGQSTAYTFEVLRDMGVFALCVFLSIKPKTKLSAQKI
jgi:uncharacterized membrane protein YphA (DoxX/SURF4 family)